MKHAGYISATIWLLALMAAPGWARADVFTDDFNRCLVSSTSKADKVVLVRHYFAFITLHPALQDISGMTPQQRTAARDAAVALYVRLLAHDCRAQFVNAAKADGTDVVKGGFSLLGGIAVRSLLTDPAVQAGLKDFGNAIAADKSLNEAKRDGDIVAPAPTAPEEKP